jgi:hypothetical protein
MYSEFRDPFTCCIVGCNTMRNHHANNSSSNLWFDPFSDYWGFLTNWVAEG